jgi:predicted dehydrogenase
MTAAARTVGVGLLGTAFMGRAHAHAYRTLVAMAEPLPAPVVLQAVAGRDARRTAVFAERFGIANASTDWRAVIQDPAVTVFDNVGPNHLHAEPTLAALAAGKHVVCEKPLALDGEQAWELLSAARRAGVKHMCAFNYRFVPAVKLARDLISDGRLGEIRHFRARYLQEWLVEPAAEVTWRLRSDHAGSGALGDLGSHIIDLARFLVGEISDVSGATQTFVHERGGERADVDEAFQALIGFESGASGTLEASRVCPGRANSLVLEVNGTHGSLVFDLERLNELWVHRADGPRELRGLQRVLVTDPAQPGLAGWWPPGHVLGWEHTFIDELHHLLSAVMTGGEVGPDGATFEDGYRAAVVCDAVLASARSGVAQRVALATEPSTTTANGDRTPDDRRVTT